MSFCTLLQAVGQTTPAGDQDDVVRITTNLVQIDAVVTKDGKPVCDLKAEDFEIYEDGRKQTITNFAFISNLPNASRPVSPAANTVGVSPAGPIQRDVARRTVAIVVDDLGMSVESMSYVLVRQLPCWLILLRDVLSSTPISTLGLWFTTPRSTRRRSYQT